MSTIAKLLVLTMALLRKIARHMEDKRVLEYVCDKQDEVASCMAFGGGDWARDCEPHAGQQRPWEGLQESDSDCAQFRRG